MSKCSSQSTCSIGVIHGRSWRQALWRAFLPPPRYCAILFGNLPFTERLEHVLEVAVIFTKGLFCKEYNNDKCLLS